MLLPSELILTDKGTIYHLDLKPGDLSSKIILVGDPGRVDEIKELFTEVEFIHQKRELRSCTGKFQGERISVVSTGMGVGCVDIVLTELDALFNIDFEKREPKKNLQKLKILRLGTCGGLSEQSPAGSLVFAEYSIGMDGLLHFYQRNLNPQEQKWEEVVKLYVQKKLNLDVVPYVAQAASNFTQKIKSLDSVVSGINVTAIGFYGPQGRNLLRAKPKQEDILDVLSKFSFENHSVMNLEMETSSLYGLGKALGHDCASLCLVLFNRIHKKGIEDYQQGMEKLLQTGLSILKDV